MIYAFSATRLGAHASQIHMALDFINYFLNIKAILMPTIYLELRIQNRRKCRCFYTLCRIL